MKDQILKIAGVKSEKEFYKKFPTEESFMAKHGKKLHKAAMGRAMVKKQLTQLTDFSNPPMAQAGLNMSPIKSFKSPTMPKMAGLNTKLSNPGFQKQAIKDVESLNPESGIGEMGVVGAAVGALPGIIGGALEIGQQKKNIAKAKIAKDVSDLGLQAVNSARRNQPQRQYVRPEDALLQPDQLGPAGGTGTNFLQMKSGGEIQNTYAPYTLYDDLGYEPLSDSEIEQYQGGGKLISSENINIDSYGNRGVLNRQIFENPNMSRDTSYTYSTPSSLVKYETNSGKPIAAMFSPDRKQMFNSAQSDSLSKYKQLLSDPFDKDIEKSYSATRKLASGKYENGGDIPVAEFGEYFQDSGQAQIGSAVGTAAGNLIGGPLGGIVGGLAGKFFGNLAGGAKQARELQAAKDATAMNQQQAAFQSVMQNEFGANMEQGGWVSHDWQPQKITKFGEYDVKDLLKPDPMMDTLRSGGHLAQVDYTAPREEALQTYAMGGNLQTHWGGSAEPMSYNPYIPGGGETVMFRGQSHDDTNSKGQSGIGITYGDNPVEVERGEPMTEMKDGGVVFGNMKIDQFAADQINDPKAKGMKYKNYVADLSKTEAKQNKILDKASKLALDKNVNNAFDQLTLNSSQASIIGANMKLKDIAQKKLDAAAVQNAILDTAEEYGLESDALSQGKIKKAKLGTNVKKAQTGNFVGGPLTPEQREKAAFSRPGDKIYDGSKYAYVEKGQLPLFARMLGAKRKPSYFNPEMTNTLMNADDRSYLVDRPINQALSDQLMYTNRQYQTFNPDLQSSLMYGTPYIQPQTAAPSATVAVVDTKNPQVATTDNATGPVTVTTAKASGSKGGSAKSSSKKVAAAPKAGKNSQVYVPPTPVQLTDNRGPNYNWDTLNKTLPVPTGSNPSQPGFTMPDSMASSNITGVDIFGNYTGPNEPFSDVSSPGFGKKALGSLKSLGQTLGKGLDKYGPTILSNVAPFLRPTDQEGLDPSQLYPEMFALATNQLEPVQAQKFQPTLQAAPSDISYQDQLNEITAQSRAAERMSQYNPEAAAAIFANVSQAKNKVLAEQFRANQARREQVFAENRQKLDDAQLKNLQILDNQYVRQSQARSATKAQALEALKSIADKTAKNRLENRQLGIYENLYNYRFDPLGRAINMNAPTQFNIPDVGASQKTKDSKGNDLLPVYNKKGDITGYRVKESKNGSIVKAIKNL